MCLSQEHKKRGRDDNAGLLLFAVQLVTRGAFWAHPATVPP
jgi:hypothetical protein